MTDCDMHTDCIHEYIYSHCRYMYGCMVVTILLYTIVMFIHVHVHCGSVFL